MYIIASPVAFHLKNLRALLMEERNCSPCLEIFLVCTQVVQTGSGVHPTSYTMGTGGSFPGVKRPERVADHSPPISAEVKKMWIYTSTPPYAFMA
jgi:hypothetical protein